MAVLECFGVLGHFAFSLFGSELAQTKIPHQVKISLECVPHEVEHADSIQKPSGFHLGQ